MMHRLQRTSQPRVFFTLCANATIGLVVNKLNMRLTLVKINLCLQDGDSSLLVLSFLAVLLGKIFRRLLHELIMVRG